MYDKKTSVQFYNFNKTVIKMCDVLNFILFGTAK